MEDQCEKCDHYEVSSVIEGTRLEYCDKCRPLHPKRKCECRTDITLEDIIIDLRTTLDKLERLAIKT